MSRLNFLLSPRLLLHAPQARSARCGCFDASDSIASRVTWASVNGRIGGAWAAAAEEFLGLP